ncbi:MAG: hypothetical protein DRI88_11985 [Bacteroidetes bacterium]|nr:MAG: hypothetical protein DRI88_11985 [Bacteroidota bacterium]
MLTAVHVVARVLGKELGMEPAEAFRAVYGITAESPFRFVMGSCNARNGIGGCANAKGDKAGAYTWGSREVEFYEGNPFAVYYPSSNRTPEQVFGYNVHTVVHELGHAFANRFKSTSEIHPYTMIGSAMFEDGKSFNTSLGYAPSPNPVSVQGYWRPNRSIISAETTANMFLGYVYGAWAADIYGNQRGAYMTNHMKNTWLPALVP